MKQTHLGCCGRDNFNNEYREKYTKHFGEVIWSCTNIVDYIPRAYIWRFSDVSAVEHFKSCPIRYIFDHHLSFSKLCFSKKKTVTQI